MVIFIHIVRNGRAINDEDGYRKCFSSFPTPMLALTSGEWSSNLSPLLRKQYSDGVLRNPRSRLHHRHGESPISVVFRGRRHTRKRRTQRAQHCLPRLWQRLERLKQWCLQDFGASYHEGTGSWPQPGYKLFAFESNKERGRELCHDGYGSPSTNQECREWYPD